MVIRLSLGGFAVVALALGWVLGLPELAALGAGFGLGALSSTWSAWRTRRVRVEIAAPLRVEAEAVAELAVVRVDKRRRNRARWRRRAMLEAAAHGSLRSAPIASGDGRVALEGLRRGVYRLHVVVTDLFGLVWWPLPLRQPVALCVHPRLHEIDEGRFGGANENDEARTSGGLPGGEAFQYLRDYVPGDEVRLIHWRKSVVRAAGTGVLWPLVRHQVVVEEPEVVVVLDVVVSSYYERPDEADADMVGAEAFEQAVQVAASLVHAGSARGTVRLALRGLDVDAVVVADRADEDDALDELAGVLTVEAGGHDIVRLGDPVPPGSVAVLVTGPLSGHARASAGLALRDQGVGAVHNVLVGGSHAPPDVRSGEEWFPTAEQMAKHWSGTGALGA